MIDRPHAILRVRDAFNVHPAVALVGPRQCGKTTLARIVAAKEDVCDFFDLEKAVDRRKLETPEQTLGGLNGLVIIDEIYACPAFSRHCASCWIALAQPLGTSCSEVLH